jgi:hypothetical protein
LESFVSAVIDKMRRSTIRLLKYLAAAALFLTVAPLSLKMLFGDQPSKDNVVVKQARGEAHGLPVDPDEMKVIHHSPVCCCVIFIHNLL